MSNETTREIRERADVYRLGGEASSCVIVSYKDYDHDTKDALRKALADGYVIVDRIVIEQRYAPPPPENNQYGHTYSTMEQTLIFVLARPEQRESAQLRSELTRVVDELRQAREHLGAVDVRAQELAALQEQLDRRAHELDERFKSLVDQANASNKKLAEASKLIDRVTTEFGVAAIDNIKVKYGLVPAPEGKTTG